jgi:signal transduction histidine kinase
VGSLLSFAGAMGIFFFLSLRKVPVYLYILLTCMIVMHGLFFTEGNLFTIILLFYVSIIASLRLNGNTLRVYIVLNLLISLGISYVQTDNIMAVLITTVFLYFLILAVNQYQMRLKEQRELYEELLGEYRKQKRVNLLAEQNARVEERNRIARDIHDSVGHRLTALIMKLEMLAIQTCNDDYRELKKMAEESLGETRQAVKALQADESEGIATVVNLIRKLEAESQIVVQFTIQQGVLTVPLSNEHSVVLYRVIQEALTNTMRHGRSREVRVVLGKSAIGDVTFEITNSIHHHQPIEFGFGLTNMRKRVEEVKGRLDVYQKDNLFYVSGVIPAQ